MNIWNKKGSEGLKRRHADRGFDISQADVVAWQPFWSGEIRRDDDIIAVYGV